MAKVTVATLENDPELKQLVVKRSTKQFEEEYADLLVCFDVDAVFTALASYFRLEGPVKDLTVPNVVAATEKAFIVLLERGALEQYVRLSPLPQAAQDQLDVMKATVGEV